MKVRKQHLGALAALVALTLAACGGGGNSTPVPSGTPPAPGPGALALITSTQNVAIAPINGVSGTVGIPGGTGTVNVGVGGTSPSGSALQSVGRTAQSLKPLASSDTALVYVSVTAATTATLNGVPGFTLTFSSPPAAGSVFEAMWNGAQWITVGSAGTVSGNTVTLAGSTTAQTITPSSPLYIVAYVGVTQAGTQSNVIIDGGFETEGAAGAFAGATNGWAVCSYPHVNAASTAASPTPVPAVTPTITAALVSSASANFTVGATPKPTATPPVPTPAPTITPAIHGGSFAALTYTGTGADTTYGKSRSAGANGICQTFVIPVSGVLTMFVNEGGNESAGDGDQEATLFVGGITALASPTPINVFNELNATTPVGTPTAAYVQKGPFALTLAPPMGLGLAAGTTATLFLGTFDNSSSNTFGEYMFVDDVSVTGFLHQ